MIVGRVQQVLASDKKDITLFDTFDGAVRFDPVFLVAKSGYAVIKSCCDERLIFCPLNEIACPRVVLLALLARLLNASLRVYNGCEGLVEEKPLPLL